MMTFLLILLLVACFAALGKAADLVVVHIRHIGQALGIGVFFLGLLLGLFTSLPELALGITALANEVPSLSLGNLLGGIPVLLGLVLGVSATLNRKIKTPSNGGSLIFTLAFLFLPFLLGLDGQIGIVDGTVLILFYLLLVYSLYAWHRHEDGLFVRLSRRRKIIHDLFLTVVGVIAVLLISQITVRVTLALLQMWDAPVFVVGLIVFALGTNLPEITVALRSWKRHAADLSISHLLGSAIVNPLLIGIFVFIHPVPIVVRMEYLTLTASVAIVLGLAYLFLRSGSAITRREGTFLIGAFVLYLTGQAATAILFK